MSPTVPLFGLEFADLTAELAAEVIASRAPDAPFRYVVTPNADHLVRLSRTPDLGSVYHGAWLRLLDSRVAARLGRLIGSPMPRTAPGSDVTKILFDQHIRQHDRITIIGLRRSWLPGLRARYGLEAICHHDPPFGLAHDRAAFDRTVQFVIGHPSRFVFLAVGSPAQERLAAAIAATGRAMGTGLCIGASLDFLTGAQQRAPVWMRRASLEWAFRLAHDPVRLARRYLISSPMIIPMLVRARLAQVNAVPSVPTRDDRVP